MGGNPEATLSRVTNHAGWKLQSDSCTETETPPETTGPGRRWITWEMVRDGKKASVELTGTGHPGWGWLPFPPWDWDMFSEWTQTEACVPFLPLLAPGSRLQLSCPEVLPLSEKAPVERTVWLLLQGNTFLYYSRSTEDTGTAKFISGICIILRGTKKIWELSAIKGKMRRYDAFTFRCLKFRFIWCIEILMQIRHKHHCGSNMIDYKENANFLLFETWLGKKLSAFGA